MAYIATDEAGSRVCGKEKKKRKQGHESWRGNGEREV